MAKGLGSSASGGAPMAAVRPMPRPAGLGGVDVQAAAPKQGGFLAERFGPQGSKARYDMAMEMLQAAMSGAASSGSPAVAFLTPLIGSAIGARATKLREDNIARESAAMIEGLMGGPLSAQAQQAMEVLNNPDAPNYLKQIAATMFRQNAVPFGQMAQPSGRSSGGARRSSGGAHRSSGGGSPRPARLTYITRDPDGAVRGYNAATGKREVVQNADAIAPDAAPAPTPIAPSLPTAPALPQDPMSDDDLIRKYLGN